MEHTKRTRIVKQILASLSKCFFAMRIAFIFKFYSKFLQHQSYVFSLWDGGRLTIVKTSFTPSILRNLTLAQPKGCQIDPQNVRVFVTRLEAQGPTWQWINF